eukprot:13791458-Ditylum_brightwellii.AAC.1
MGRKEEQPMLFCPLFVLGNSCDQLLLCNLGLTTPESGIKLFSLFAKLSDGRSSDHNGTVVVGSWDIVKGHTSLSLLHVLQINAVADVKDLEVISVVGDSWNKQDFKVKVAI